MSHYPKMQPTHSLASRMQTPPPSSASSGSASSSHPASNGSYLGMVAGHGRAPTPTSSSSMAASLNSLSAFPPMPSSSSSSSVGHPQQHPQHQHQLHQQQQQQLVSPSSPSSSSAEGSVSKERIYQLVLELSSPDKRESALLELSKKREAVPDLAPILWHSFGTIACLLQEIVGIYPLLSPPKLKAHASNRVCNALALLQCVASHPETRTLFLKAHIPLFLYPFLNTVSKTRPFEYLRLTSLGVIGALVKMDDPDVINFLLTTEIIPLCLRIMETGSELSKTVATFIIQKILLDNTGLIYICTTYERFYAVSTVLSNMVAGLVEAPSQRLLKHIIRCYLRLSDNPKAREALRSHLPEPFHDGTFANYLKDDHTTTRWLAQLLMNLRESSPSAADVLGVNNPNLSHP
ncbi:Cell differentiation protein RCD1 [Balamuthia mandrillaris]